MFALSHERSDVDLFWLLEKMKELDALRSELFNYIRQGDANKFKESLADKIYGQEVVCTALWNAIDNFHFEHLNRQHLLLITKMVWSYVSTDFDINSRLNNGLGCLLFATKLGNVRIVDYCLQIEGLHVNHQDQYGWTPLMYAVNNGNESIIQGLLDRKADPHHYDKDTLMTPLLLAAERGLTNIAKILIPVTEDLDHEARKGVTAIYLASSKGHTEIVQALVDGNADVNYVTENNESCLIPICRYGHFEICKFLLENGANPHIQNHSGKVPIQKASYFGNEDCLLEVLKYIDPGTIDTTDEKGETAFVKACNSGNIHIAEILLEHGADIDFQTELLGETALMYACFEGHNLVVDVLLKNKADVNRQSQRSGNALMIASKRGYRPIIDKLLEANADPMLSDYRGMNAIKAAKDRGHKDIAKLLKRNSNSGRTSCIIS